MTTYDIYDTMNRLRQQTVKQSPNPDAVTKYGYDATGLLQTMQDPRLVATGSTSNYSYDYDLMGRKLDVTYPPDSGGIQRKELYRYDIAARLGTFTNRAGNVQTFTYDALHRQTGFSWNDGGLTPSVSFGYDVAGRMLKIENANATITRSYYNDNLLKSETTNYADNLDRSVTYTYDADGRRANIVYPNGAYSFDYTYTSRNQLKTIQNSSASLPAATYAYDRNGNLTTRTLNNDTSSTFTYDELNRMTNLSHALSGGVRTISYGYDNVSRRIWSKRGNGSGDVFGYDLSDQVTATKLNIPNPDTTAVGAQTISYDANGNRTSFAPYGTTETYTSNNLNQYSSRNSSQAVYDSKGNVTTGLDGSTYTYDAHNRLLTASKAGTTETFTYDGLNRQVSRKVGTAAVFYRVYDGWDLLGEYAVGSANPYNAYLHGAGGLVKNLETNRYYYQDASGSTSALASNTGGLLEWYWYDLQGEPIFYNPGNAQISASAYAIRHLFTGQQWYSKIGLYDLRNRFYSPDIGRFLQPDPIGFEGDPTNLYRYCGGDPVNRSDPSGLETLKKPLEAMQVAVSIGSNPLEDGYEFGYDLNTGFGSTERVTVGGPPPEPGTGWGAGDSIGSGGPGAGDGSGSGSGSGRGNPYRSSAPFIAEAGQGINGPSLRRFAGAIETGVSTYVSLTIGPWGEGGAAIALAESGLLRTAAKTAPLALPPPSVVPNAGGAIRSFLQGSNQVYYRVFSGSQQGAFLTAVPLRSSAFARQALSLPPSNQATLIQEVLVPAGTRLQRSRALPVFGARGGAEQFQLLDQIPTANFGAGVPYP